MSKKTFAQFTQEPDNGAHSFTEASNPWSFCETPEEKCTMNYCDENGCMNRKRAFVSEIEKVETLYRKVVVSERMPKVDQRFIAIDYRNDKINEVELMVLDSQKQLFFYFPSDIHTEAPEYWLEEIPDTTAQLKADKAELLSALEKGWEVVTLDTYEARRWFYEIDSLIKKHKQ